MERTFLGPFRNTEGFDPKKCWRWFALWKEEKEVRERKVVVRQGRGIDGEPAGRLGGARGTKGDSPPSETVPGGEQQRRS
jgi:hypothetical protein